MWDLVHVPPKLKIEHPLQIPWSWWRLMATWILRKRLRRWVFLWWTMMHCHQAISRRSWVPLQSGGSKWMVSLRPWIAWKRNLTMFNRLLTSNSWHAVASSYLCDIFCLAKTLLGVTQSRCSGPRLGSRAGQIDKALVEVESKITSTNTQGIIEGFKPEPLAFNTYIYYSNVITKLIGLCQRHFVFPARPLAHLPFSACPQLAPEAAGSVGRDVQRSRASSALSGNAVDGAVPVGMHSLHASCMCYWYGLCFMSLCMHVRNSPFCFWWTDAKFKHSGPHKLHYNYDSLQLHGKRGSNTLSPWSRVRPWDPHGP